MALSEVDVIIKDGTDFVRSFQQGARVFANDGIDCEELAKKNHIICLEPNLRNLGFIQFG